jgi:adenosylmethionine-8-amino-7-oxononanoate aminotransferase
LIASLALATMDHGELPSMKNKRVLIRRDRRYVWHPFTQMYEWEREKPLIIQSARGCFLRDIEGNRYIDGVSSLWVNVHGHGRSELDRAIHRQMKKVAHSTLLGLGSVPSIELARELVRITPPGLNRVFYSDDGSTAVEISLKVSYQFWHNKGKYRDKRLFIKFENGYHGDTIGAVSVGGIDLFHEIYRPLLFPTLAAPSFYCYRCPLGKNRSSCSTECLSILEALIRKNRKRVAALIIEPIIQAAGGMVVAPEGHLARVEKLCRRYDILFIVDEVATGFGRTGRMFACEHEGVSPDIMVVAKGLTGGYLPLAATLVTDRIYDGFRAPYRLKKTFFHGHSYTGNALSCAAAIANLHLFRKERTLVRLRPKIRLLESLLQGFRTLEHVGDVRQIGLMAGIELVRSKRKGEAYSYATRMGHRVCMRARRYGLIIRPLGDVVVIMPPLSISERLIGRMLDIIYRCIEEETG